MRTLRARRSIGSLWRGTPRTAPQGSHPAIRGVKQQKFWTDTGTPPHLACGVLVPVTNQTAILVGRIVSEALAVEGTHRYQLAALATLDAFGAVSQAELCRRTNIDRSDINAVVNVLEAEGIVTRVSDPDDRRQNIVEMTETGKARFVRLKAGLAEAEDRALAPLAPADRRELLRLLRILHDYHAVPPPSAESRD